MNPVQTENKPVEKIDQAQTQTQEPIVQAKTVQEPAPEIKTEENKANWKAFREQRESERKAREDSERRASEKAAEAQALRAALEAITNKPSNNRQMNEYDSQDTSETEEQRIDRRVETLLREREERAEKERKLREQQEFPQKLKQTYGDFDKVCTTENLDYLEYHYPEVAMPFSHLPDGYDKWQAIYKAVKRFVPNTDSRQDSLKAERNLQKPASISSPGNTQGGNAMPSAKLDAARKAANWERMERTLKGLSN